MHDPEARLRDSNRRRRWFESYLRSLIDRDLREISDRQKISELPRLLRRLASQAASLYSANSVATSTSMGTEFASGAVAASDGSGVAASDDGALATEMRLGL